MLRLYLFGLLFVFFSCSSGKENPLLGRWHVIKLSQQQYGTYEYNPQVDTSRYYLTFLNDSIFLAENKRASPVPDTQHYRLSNDTIFANQTYLVYKLKGDTVISTNAQEAHETVMVKVK